MFLPSTLFERVGTPNTLELVFTRKGRPIGVITVTRDPYDRWDHHEKMEDVAKAQDVIVAAGQGGSWIPRRRISV